MAYHVPLAAQAANEQRKRQRKEEEEMTPYTREELDDGWEFKIIRSPSPVFRKPEVLAALLDEEALAGWELVEKFDNRRIRLKRPRSARAKDQMLPPGFDPYRTQFGVSRQTMSALLVLILLGLMVLLALLGIFSFGGLR